MSLIYRSRRRRPRRFALLDRDGILNVDTGYPSDPAQLVMVPGATDLCRRLQSAGYALVVVTNQGGLARGYFKESDYLAFTNALRERIRSAGAHLDLILPCPHYSGGAVPGLARWCGCRKPRPGLLTRALRQYGGRRRQSLMIGDSERDILAARRAGVRRSFWLRPKPGFRRSLHAKGVRHIHTLTNRGLDITSPNLL